MTRPQQLALQERLQARLTARQRELVEAAVRPVAGGYEVAPGAVVVDHTEAACLVLSRAATSRAA